MDQNIHSEEKKSFSGSAAEGRGGTGKERRSEDKRLRKESMASLGSTKSKGSKISKGSSKGSHSKSLQSGASTDGGTVEAPMRKYGQIPLRDKIKTGNLVTAASASNQVDVGTYIQREIFQNQSHQLQKAPLTEHQQKMAAYSISLHDELLETHLRREGIDRFADQYDPHGDLMLSAGFERVRKDEVRAANDTGTSLSKERFSTKYWDTWRQDVMILEKISTEKAMVTKKELSNFDILREKKEKMVKMIQKSTPSLLPGTSFGLPRTERSEFFDFHMQGNRNTTSQLHKHSLGVPVPVSFHTPAFILPADPDPDRFGNNTSGGVMAMGPSRGVQAKMASANIDFPPVDVPKGNPKMLSFGTAARIAPLRLAINSGGGGEDKVAIGSKSLMPGNKFGEEARGGGIPDTRRSYPGPGTYNVPGIFDKFELPDYQVVIDKINKSGADFRSIPVQDLTKLGGFAFGCNRQEHVLYGFCLDGQCHKRIEFERAFLQTKKFKRLGVATVDECNAVLPGSKSMIIHETVDEVKDTPLDLDIFNIDGNAALTRLEDKYKEKERSIKLRREFVLSLVADPKEYVYPLHMAASRADLAALKKMRILGLDINLKQGEKDDTPLHLAVRNQHLKAVNAIVEIFDGVVDVNIENKLCDTPLHVAARKGFKDIVEALCDADANPLLKNDQGLTPLQEAKAFTIQQLLRLQEDIFQLRMELSETESAVMKARKKAATLSRMESQGMELGAYLADESSRQTDEVSEADRIQFPWRASIASRGGGTAPSSRVSSTRSTRSRLLEITNNSFDAEADAAKTNTSLYRVARTKTMLKDSTKNSYVMGYLADDSEK